MYEVSTGVRSTRNEDGGIVLDIGRGQMFRLNVVGALILDAIKTGKHESQVVDELVQQFQAPREEVNADTRGFLAALERMGLIVSRNTPERPK